MCEEGNKEEEGEGREEDTGVEGTGGGNIIPPCASIFFHKT